MAQHPQGLSEHQLLGELQALECFEGWVSGDATLALFQKHFAIMHCLYHLQPLYLSRGMALNISPLNIQLSPSVANSGSGNSLSESQRGLADFYQNWKHFDEATPDTVTDLLRSFWQRYVAEDAATEALDVLGLDATANWEQVQIRYRQLVADHHPDKGGDQTQFTEVRQAYETLKKRNR